MDELNHNDDCCECGCDNDCDHNHDSQTMTLVLDDNTELKCTVIDIFDVGDKSYIALLPIGDDEVLLYQYVETEDDGFDLLNIETDEEFKEVEEAFFELFEEDTFEEDDEDSEEE